MTQLSPIPHRGFIHRPFHALFILHPQVRINPVLQPGKHCLGRFQFVKRATRAFGVADAVAQRQAPAVPHMINTPMPWLAHFIELAAMVDLGPAALAFDEVVIGDVFA
ncbi:hypothetical protein D3C87_1688310 [compost metagenome]